MLKHLIYLVKIKNLLDNLFHHKNSQFPTRHYIRKKNIENIKNGLFDVHLFSWEDIVDLIDENKQDLISLVKIVEKMCHNPAILYRIEKRGFIREGYFADLTIIDLNTSWIVSKENILSKCGWSPLEGTTFQTKVTNTFVNGNLVYDNGEFNENAKGQPLKIIN